MTQHSKTSKRKSCCFNCPIDKVFVRILQWWCNVTSMTKCTFLKSSQGKTNLHFCCIGGRANYTTEVWVKFGLDISIMAVR